MEALVKVSFPGEPIDTVSDLLVLGRKKGCPMPDLSTLSSINDDIDVSQGAEDTPRLESLAAHAHSDRNETHLQSHSQPTDLQYTVDSPRLIQDTSGRSHYIGPSGSLSFFAELRQLISTRQPASRFASDNLAEALEARPESEIAPIPAEENVISSPATVASAVESLRSASYLRTIPLRVLEDLLRLFFDKVHSDFPLFNRGLFLDRFERFFISSNDRPGGVDRNLATDEGFAQMDDGWLVCLHMMIAFGCVLRRATREDNLSEVGMTYRSVQQECWNVARASLGRLTTMCVQSHVQALLLVSLYLHSISERNASWVLVGCAARIAIAIGLHRTELHNNFSLMEREMRKRIWCTLYGFEQFLCLSLGRPSAIDDEEVKASVPSDEIMSSGSGPPGFTEFQDYLYQLSPKLRKTMSIHYRTSDGPEDSCDVTTSTVLNELELWEKELPSHLHILKDLTEQQIPSELDIAQLRQLPAHHLRNVILLHIQYNELILSATRPYLLMTITTSFQGPSSTGGPNPWDTPNAPTLRSGNQIWTFARKCVASAFRIASLTIVLDHFDLLNGLTWLDVYYSYSAAMVLLLRVLWVPGPGASHESLIHERTCKDSAIQFVAAVRKALQRVSKSSTMHRFFAVLEKFADVVAHSVLPTMQQQFNGLSHSAISGEIRPNFSLENSNDRQHDHEHSLRPLVDISASSNSRDIRYQGQSSLTEGPLYNYPSIAERPEQDSYPTNQRASDIHQYEEDDSLPEAARVLSSFSQDAMYGGPVLWDNSFQTVTQHILDWNDFEQFLGRWSTG